MFQSRSGFSPCLDPLGRSPRLPQRCRRFNPVPGFLPASTAGPSRVVANGGGFQSRSGFSPCLDRKQRLHHPEAESVSIPFRVFSLPRRSVITPGAARRRFQSRSGFSPCLDRKSPRPSPPSAASFNPVPGFLPASTSAVSARPRERSGFNPVPGFLPASTEDWSVEPDGFDEFQSRSGFSPCLDRTGHRGASTAGTRFNPVPGFLPASTARATTEASGSFRFQSRSGFSPCLDPE